MEVCATYRTKKLPSGEKHSNLLSLFKGSKVFSHRPGGSSQRLGILEIISEEIFVVYL